MYTKRYTALNKHAVSIFVIIIRMALEIEKVGKFFLKIGNAGYMIGSLKADINAGTGIA